MHESEATMHESEVLGRKNLPLRQVLPAVSERVEMQESCDFTGVFAMARRLLRYCVERA